MAAKASKSKSKPKSGAQKMKKTVAGKIAAVAKKLMAAGAKKKAEAPGKKGAPAKAVAPAVPVKGAKSAKGQPAPVPAAAPVKGKRGQKMMASYIPGANTPAAIAAAQAAAKLRGGTLPTNSLKADASAESVCREVACEGLATSNGYCRLHYIKNWKKVKRKELILKEKKLNQYIEELVAKYPDKYIEAIRQDLASDKDFAKVISDLDLDESVDDFEMDESVDSMIDSIKRDFEDEGEGF